VLLRLVLHVTGISLTPQPIGVYTSRKVPFGYTASTQKAILSRALPGTHRVGDSSITGEDSWMPMGSQDWIIFKDGGQLMPIYVVHFC
jgi:hypothetical protein